jgi:hypothetical protein
VAGALALALTSFVLAQTRSLGIENANVGKAATGFSIDAFVMKEQTVWSMAQAVEYVQVFGHTDGRSTAAIAVFWIPRALWPDKPTLMGYWLPRAFGGATGFSEGFSAAPGFTGTTFVDFGLWGSVVAWLIGGLLFGFLERRVASYCTLEHDARTIMVAPLFGAAFFAVRSIDTALLVISGIYVYLGCILVIGGQRSRSSPRLEKGQK